ncbi:hypothetical protein Q7P37_000981 [Cladosporium fusiforme]
MPSSSTHRTPLELALASHVRKIHTHLSIPAYNSSAARIKTAFTTLLDLDAASISRHVLFDDVAWMLENMSEEECYAALRARERLVRESERLKLGERLWEAAMGCSDVEALEGGGGGEGEGVEGTFGVMGWRWC